MIQPTDLNALFYKTIRFLRAHIINTPFIATLGYLKITKPEDFDPVKFLLTVTVGAISGYLTFALGWTQEAVAAWFETTGIIVWIEYGLKTFVRRLSTI